MIPSVSNSNERVRTVYQRGWMIDSQLLVEVVAAVSSISKGMDD